MQKVQNLRISSGFTTVIPWVYQGTPTHNLNETSVTMGVGGKMTTRIIIKERGFQRRYQKKEGKAYGKAHKRGQKMIPYDLSQIIKVEELIAAETRRISEQYGKSFLDCEDIVKLTGLGRDNVRTLMKSKSFPVIRIGNRQVVSILSFVTWQISSYIKGGN